MRSLAKRLLLGFILVSLPSVVFADDVDAILKRWSEHAAKHGTRGLHGTARLYTYDSVHQRETRRRVEFWSDGRDHWQIEFSPADVDGKTSRMMGIDGSPYQLRTPGKSERWARTGASLIHQTAARNETPSARRVNLAASNVPDLRTLSERLADWPAICAEDLAVPLHIGSTGLTTTAAPDAAAASPWQIELGGMNGKSGRIHLMVTHAEEQREIKEPRYEILLKADDFSPVGVKVADPLRMTETVYAFETVEELARDSAILNTLGSRPWP